MSHHPAFRKTFLVYDLRCTVARCCCHTNLPRKRFSLFDQWRLVMGFEPGNGLSVPPHLNHYTSPPLVSYNFINVYKQFHIYSHSYIIVEHQMRPPRHMTHSIILYYGHMPWTLHLLCNQPFHI